MAVKIEFFDMILAMQYQQAKNRRALLAFLCVLAICPRAIHADDDLLLLLPSILASQNTQPAGFFEDFSGDQGLSRFRTGVYHRDNVLVAQTSWPGDHNLACDPPPTTRLIQRASLQDYIYLCKDHLMTSVGDTAGYSIAWFSPARTFSNITQVCWSVNLTELGSRQWWKVAVLNVAAPDIMSDVDASNLTGLDGTDRSVASWGGVGGAPGKLRIGKQRLDYPNLISGSDKKTRYPACFRDNNNGTVTLELTGPKEGGALSTETFTVNGKFPDGPLKVVFQDHNYTPTKDDNGVGGEPIGFTWHWDDISIR